MVFLRKTAFISFEVLVALFASLNMARAGEPVAIVESISAATEGLAFMDYLEEGQIIDLKAGEILILGYLFSCWEERIVGGRVIVGREKSIVENGKVQREQVDCDGGAIRLSVDQADKSGVWVFRKPPKRRLTLYGVSPVLLLSGAGGSVTIERLDKPGARLTLTIEGRFVDLAESSTTLVPGAIYRATVGDVALDFQIDPLAMPGPSPVVGRLLRF